MLGLCFVLQYFVPFLVLKSSGWGRESWVLYFCCVLNAMFLLSFFGPSSRCRGLVCSMYLWHSLVVLTYFSITSAWLLSEIGNMKSLS